MGNFFAQYFLGSVMSKGFRYCFVLSKREIVTMPNGGKIFQRKSKIVA
jgi:hypothetical protein